MSFDLMAAVWKLELPALEKWVLMALADEDRGQGAGVWPSLETLSAKTGLSVRSVSRELGRLVQHKFLVPQGSRSGGRSRSTRYQIDLSAGQAQENLDRQSRFMGAETRTDSLGLDQKVQETWTEMHVNLDCQSREPVIKPISEPMKANDDDLALTMTWLASECPRLTKLRLAELSLPVAQFPAGHRREWCAAAIARMPPDPDKQYRWLLKAFNNAWKDGMCPGTNPSGPNGNGHTAPALDDAAALKAYYTPAEYAGIIEH